MMRGIAALSALVALYLLVWSGPVAQLTAGPRERAATFVTLTICQGRPTSFDGLQRQQFSRAPPSIATHTPAQIDELAQPFVPHFAHGWRTELATVLLAGSALGGLLARRPWAALLSAAAVVAFAHVYGLTLNSFSLLWAAGPRLWWAGVSQWPPELIRDQLLVPIALGLVAFHALVALARAGHSRWPAAMRWRVLSRRSAG